MEELPYVLWLYRMTVHTDTKKTPFKLTFGQDMIILVEIGQTLDCVLRYSKDVNDRLKAENLYLVQEDKEMAYIRLVAYKEKVKKYFDK